MRRAGRGRRHGAVGRRCMDTSAGVGAYMSSQDAGARRVYFFGEGQADGGHAARHLIGGKGASLAEMTRAGLNVPPGFTISAECCERYFQAGKKFPDGLEEEIRLNLTRL